MTYKTTAGETPKTAMLRVLGVTLLALALLLGVRAPASAQSVCTTHAEVTKQLESRHSESPVGIGLASTGQVLEVFTTGDGSSWTIVMTRPDGMSCLVASGDSWENLPRVVLGPQA